MLLTRNTASKPPSLVVLWSQVAWQEALSQLIGLHAVMFWQRPCFYSSGSKVMQPAASLCVNKKFKPSSKMCLCENRCISDFHGSDSFKRLSSFLTAYCGQGGGGAYLSCPRPDVWRAIIWALLWRFSSLRQFEARRCLSFSKTLCPHADDEEKLTGLPVLFGTRRHGGGDSSVCFKPNHRL